MAITTNKVTIFTAGGGREGNDTPNTPTDLDYPNGAVICAILNSLIDELNAYTTDDLNEGSSNFYYTDARARQAISISGNGSYNSSTGVITISNATQSVDNIQLTSTSGNVDTYTIWADAGRTTSLGTFTVTNGVDGQDVDHISLTSTSGNVDTYTVWGDVGETINLGTFTVTNGIDGTSGTNGTDGQGIDNVALTSTASNVDTYTVWGDVGQTINLGTFTVTNGTPPPVVELTQAAYDALGTPDPNTFYAIAG